MPRPHPQKAHMPEGSGHEIKKGLNNNNLPFISYPLSPVRVPVKPREQTRLHHSEDTESDVRLLSAQFTINNYCTKRKIGLEPDLSA